ncbi:hypothetical protein ACHAPT_006083 [Fusarium lateritium]
MAALLAKLFRRKKQPPMVCAVSLDDHGHPIAEDPNHKHTAACFVDFEPLSLIELFQSQGCQSCPPAVPDILEATKDPNLLLLTYNVTLFDHTGWKDTFANNASDQRQRAYAMRWQRKTIFTPQIVINGVADGSSAGDVQQLVQQARTARAGMGWQMYLDVNDTHVRIDSTIETVDRHDILVILYQEGDEKVKIRKGPNKGKKLNHRNVVTNMMKIGEWVGGDLTIPLPASRDSMKPGEEAVVVVQEGGAGGPIVAVAKV